MEAKHLTLKRLIALSSQGDCAQLIEDFSGFYFDGKIRIGIKEYKPQMTLQEFQSTITWGQRLFFAKEPENFLDGVLRMFCGTFYTALTGKDFDMTKCLSVGKKALNCNVDQLLPFSVHMIKMVEALLVDEYARTGGKEDKTWTAAGGAKLNKYGDLLTLDFLASELSLTYGKQMGHNDVLAAPYLDCLVRLSKRKEFAEVEDEYRDLSMIKATSKSKQ